MALRYNNITGAAEAVNKVNSASDLIMVTPNQTIGYAPQNRPSEPDDTEPPPKILFHTEGEQTVSLQSEITDHYIEDNTAISDNIALAPEEVTTSGFVGELNNVPPAILESLKFISQKLVTLEPFTPGLSVKALKAYNDAAFAYEVTSKAVNSAANLAKSVAATVGTLERRQTIQQEYFTQFYTHWRERRLFTVQTPWGIFQNMGIKRLRAIQDPDTRMISDFEITFKAIRFAVDLRQFALDGAAPEFIGPLDEEASKRKAAARAKSQNALKVFLGNSTPDEHPNSFTDAYDEISGTAKKGFKAIFG